jgi:protein-export membrane protein SecD
MLCANCGRELAAEDEVCSCGGMVTDLVESVQSEVLSPGAPSGPTSPGQAAVRRGARWRVWLIVLCVAILGSGAGYGVHALVHHFTHGGVKVFVTFEAQKTARASVTAEALQQCVTAVEKRLSGMGLDSFTVKTEGADRIVVGLPEDAYVKAVTDVVQQPGALEFYAVADFSEVYYSSAEALSAAGVGSVKDLPSGTSLIYWPVTAMSDSGQPEYYLVSSPPALTGAVLKESGFDSATDTGGYRVTMQFTAEGGALFAQITKELAEVGDASDVAQRLAIVLDGNVYSAPTVIYEITGGSAEITGTFTLEEARDLAAIMHAGVMPLNLTLVE